jgi:hypothetical protein
MDSIAALTCLSAASDFGIKHGNYALGHLGYIAVPFVLEASIAEHGVAWTNNMWNAGTSILETGLGVMEGEQLGGQQLAGICFILIGMKLLWKNK